MSLSQNDGGFMSHVSHQVLLYHASSEVIDKVFAALDTVDLPSIRILPVLNQEQALLYSQEQEFSLVISAFGKAEDGSLNSLFSAQFPRPVIALLDSDCEMEDMKRALRIGAADLFFTDEVSKEAEALAASVGRCLQRSQLLEDGKHSRKELELRLAELKEDQQAALHIQQKMLPPEKLRAIDGIEARYVLTPSLYLSGDFVDVVRLDERYCMFYLADVSGHGASSALVTVLLKSMTNRLVRNFKRRSSFDILSPTNTLRRINSDLLDTGLGKHLTIFAGLFDLKTDSLHYAVGGHHPLPIYLAEDKAYYLKGRGMPLGLFEEPMFDESTIKLDKEFSLTLFSDGILEMLPQSSLEEKEQFLLDQLSSANTTDPELLKSKILAEGQGDAPDDIAIMILARQ